MIEIPIAVLIVSGVFVITLAAFCSVLFFVCNELSKLHKEAWKGWQDALAGWEKSNNLLREMTAPVDEWPEEIDQ